MNKTIYDYAEEIYELTVSLENIACDDGLEDWRKYTPEEIVKEAEKSRVAKRQTVSSKTVVTDDFILLSLIYLS